MTPGRRTFVGLLVGLLVLGAGAWIFQDDLSEWWRGVPDDAGPAPGEVSAERADAVEDRIRAFASGEGPDSLVLGTADLRSLIRHRGEALLPPGVRDPDASLTDSTALLRGVLVAAELPERDGGGEGGALAALLGDTTELRAEVVPSLARTGVAELRVRALDAGSMSVPSMLVPTLLRRSGLPVEGGRPRSVVFAVPDPLSGISVREGRLILRRSPPDDPG